MKRLSARLLSLCVCLALLSGCGSSPSAPDGSTASQGDSEDPIRVARLLPGSASDRSWSQFGYEALMQVQEELGAEVVYSENIADAPKGIDAADNFAGSMKGSLKSKGPDCQLSVIYWDDGSDEPAAKEAATALTATGCGGTSKYVSFPSRRRAARSRRPSPTPAFPFQAGRRASAPSVREPQTPVSPASSVQGIQKRFYKKLDFQQVFRKKRELLCV